MMGTVAPGSRAVDDSSVADFFESAPVALCWMRSDGTIIRANRAELDLLGYSQEEYIGHHISEFHADTHLMNDVLRHVQAAEELRDYGARLRCKDGSIKHVLISSNVLCESGKFAGACCFTRDITDQKWTGRAQSRFSLPRHPARPFQTRSR